MRASCSAAGITAGGGVSCCWFSASATIRCWARCACRRRLSATESSRASISGSYPAVSASSSSAGTASGELRDTRPRLSSSKAYELAFRPVYDELCSGELQAWARRDILDERQAIPASVWRSLRFWDTDWERGVIFPSLPHRTLYDVLVAPATAMSKVPNGAGGSATKRRSGPNPDKRDAVAGRMREDVEKNGGTDFLKNMKVELLVEHYGKPVSPPSGSVGRATADVCPFEARPSVQRLDLPRQLGEDARVRGAIRHGRRQGGAALYLL